LREGSFWKQHWLFVLLAHAKNKHTADLLLYFAMAAPPKRGMGRGVGIGARFHTPESIAKKIESAHQNIDQIKSSLVRSQALYFLLHFFLLVPLI
jgi:hypothetical protein